MDCFWMLGFFQRLRGLLGTFPGQATGSALVFEHTHSLHTLGMRYPIDVAFLDGDGRVVMSERAVRPGRVRFCRQGLTAVEREASASPWFILGDVPRFVCGTQ